MPFGFPGMGLGFHLESRDLVLQPLNGLCELFDSPVEFGDDLLGLEGAVTQIAHGLADLLGPMALSAHRPGNGFEMGGSVPAPR